jgi:hypothetical protein
METQSPLALLASVVSVLDFVKRDNISARRLERLSVTPRTDIYQDHQRRKQNLVGFTPQKVGTDQKIAGIFPCPSPACHPGAVGARSTAKREVEGVLARECAHVERVIGCPSPGGYPRRLFPDGGDEGQWA